MRLARLLLCLYGLVQTVYANDKMKTKTDNKLEQKHPEKVSSINTGKKTDGNKTKLLSYEYNFWSETRIYEEKTKDKEALIETINASYTFDVLHYDPYGKILGRYRLLKCINGPCHDMPDIYVDFIQGGNNLVGLYVASDNTERNVNWNVLFAVAYSIITPAKSGAGDEQIVITPYGLCNYIFSKTQDKVFRRRIKDCQFDGIRNHSAMDGLTVHDYKHSVNYIQNVKVDPDIVVVETEEELSIKSLLNRDWSLVVKSQSRMEMANRIVFYMERFCSRNLSAGDCAQQTFKAEKLGRNWKEIKQALNIGVRRKPFKLHSILKKSSSELPGRNADVLIPILKSILFATEEDLSSAVKEFRNTSVMPLYVDALGLAGTKASYTVAKDILTAEAPEYTDRFLQALAQTTKIDLAIVNDLKDWMKNTKDKNLKEQIAFTTATLYRRYCQSSKSRKNACDNGKDRDVNDFTKHIIECQNSECEIKALQILENFPLRSLISFASKFLCNESNATKPVQIEALRFLQCFDGNYLQWETVVKLLHIFRNTCPLQQTVADQTLAIEVLMNTIPRLEMVGSYMLRSEELFPLEQEKWAYFYKSVDRRRQMDSNVNSYWAKMRSFRAFRANYAQRSLNATSDLLVVDIAELGDYKLTIWIKTTNDQGILSWNDISVVMTSRKKSLFSIMEVFVETNGLQSYLLNAGTFSGSDRDGHKDVWTSIQFSILNNRMVPKILFDGFDDLLSVIWNINGQPEKIYDTNLVHRLYYCHVPLMSGLSVTVDIMGTLSITVLGSAAINFWNMGANMVINSTISSTLEGNINLASTDGHLIGWTTASTFAAGTVNIQFDGNFYAVPHLLCTIVSHSPVTIRQSYMYSLENGKEKRLLREKKLPSSTLLLSQKISEHCHLMQSHYAWT